MINRENLIKIGRAGGNTSNRETPDQIGRVGMSVAPEGLEGAGPPPVLRRSSSVLSWSRWILSSPCNANSSTCPSLWAAVPAKNPNVANNLESIETAYQFFSRRSEHFRNDKFKMHLDRCPAFKWKTQLINGLGNAEIVVLDHKTVQQNL